MRYFLSYLMAMRWPTFWGFVVSSVAASLVVLTGFVSVGRKNIAPLEPVAVCGVREEMPRFTLHARARQVDSLVE